MTHICLLDAEIDLHAGGLDRDLGRTAFPLFRLAKVLLLKNSPSCLEQAFNYAGRSFMPQRCLKSAKQRCLHSVSTTGSSIYKQFYECSSSSRISVWNNMVKVFLKVCAAYKRSTEIRSNYSKTVSARLEQLWSIFSLLTRLYGPVMLRFFIFQDAESSLTNWSNPTLFSLILSQH